MSTEEPPQDTNAEQMEQLNLDQPAEDASDPQEILKAAIRRQVEYYFSDVNLATDKYLLGKMKGSKNKPIPLRLINSFKKMRSFEPFSVVVQAVRESEVLDVVSVTGQTCVVRKDPFFKPKSGKKKPKPTGFEENWTEAPITPAEHAQNRDLYDTEERTFIERMETAMHRYRARRRFLPRTANIYTKFLSYGGIDTGQKQYSGGMARQELEDKDADEIAAMAAIDFIGEDKFDCGPGKKWDVDFELVAKGFLSSVVPVRLDPRTDAQIREIVNVLRNFYNYILLHDVCPEYKESVLAAREICNVAERELRLTTRATVAFPGEFQLACSTLFGGFFKGMYVEDDEWYQDFKGPQMRRYLSEERAREVFKSAIPTLGSVEFSPDSKFLLDENLCFSQKISASEQSVGLEVTKIIQADEAEEPFSDVASEPPKQRLGRLVCKPWELPTFETFDKAAQPGTLARPEEYIFVVDQDVLDCCFEGMKFETTIHTLDSGLKFFDNVLAVYCSFYTLTYNETLKQKEKAERRRKAWISKQVIV